jgi:hypothetical protein
LSGGDAPSSPPDFHFQKEGSMTSSVYKGGCLCGAVRFSTRGPLRAVVACHCSQCRRQSGHFWAATNVADGDLSMEGAERLKWYSATLGVTRGFCGDCGSFLFWKMESLDHISIGAGAFDAPTGLALDRHIFCADKGDYYEITDGLPRYDASSPDIATAE